MQSANRGRTGSYAPRFSIIQGELQAKRFGLNLSRRNSQPLNNLPSQDHQDLNLDESLGVNLLELYCMSTLDHVIDDVCIASAKKDYCLELGKDPSLIPYRSVPLL